MNLSAFTEDKVVRSKDLPERSRANRVHGAWFQIHEDGSGNVLPSWTRTNNNQVKKDRNQNQLLREKVNKYNY